MHKRFKWLLLIALVNCIPFAGEKPAADEFKVTIINDRQMPVSVTATSNGKTLYQNRLLGKKSIDVKIAPESNLQVRVYEGGISKIWNAQQLRRRNAMGMAIRIIPEGEFSEESGFKLDQNYYK